jgi:hypothetical protein
MQAAYAGRNSNHAVPAPGTLRRSGSGPSGDPVSHGCVTHCGDAGLEAMQAAGCHGVILRLTLRQAACAGGQCGQPASTTPAGLEAVQRSSLHRQPVSRLPAPVREFLGVHRRSPLHRVPRGPRPPGTGIGRQGRGDRRTPFDSVRGASGRGASALSPRPRPHRNQAVRGGGRFGASAQTAETRPARGDGHRHTQQVAGHGGQLGRRAPPRRHASAGLRGWAVGSG